MNTAVLILLALDGALFIALFGLLARMDQRLQRIERKIYGRSGKSKSMQKSRKREEY